MYGVVYKITNTKNGKVYIGQTTEINNPKRRMQRHTKKANYKSLIHESIKKYGIEYFNFEVLCSCYNQEDLNYCETFLIASYSSVVPNGYNIKLGGNQGGKCSETLKTKLSEILKEGYKTGKIKAYNKGRKFSREHLQNLSKVRKGFTSVARVNAIRSSAKKRTVGLRALNLETKQELIFDSIQECAAKLNLQHYNISRVLRGDQNRTQHKGWTFLRKKVDISQETCQNKEDLCG